MVKCIQLEDGKEWIHMKKQTHTNPFSKREMEILRNNPNVASVSETTVRFTKEFKELLYLEKQNGRSICHTLQKGGIDPGILGQSRIDGIRYTLNKQAAKENGFSDLRSNNYRHSNPDREESTTQRIKRLENELVYTRQEVEFLKKIQMANLEAQKEWESKHRPK